MVKIETNYRHFNFKINKNKNKSESNMKITVLISYLLGSDTLVCLSSKSLVGDYVLSLI